MWAVVLLPRWLGSSDRYRDKRSVSRFRRSLNSMSKASARRGHRSHDVSASAGRGVSRVDTAPDDGAIDHHLDTGADPFVGSPEDSARQRARSHQKRAKALADSATRRRRTMAGLGAVTALAAVGALLGLASWLLPVVCGLALVGFVYLARSRSRSVAAARNGRADGRAEQTSAPAVDERTWAPRTAPEPRYMREPKATNFPREIDSTENGPWTAERMLEQAAALRTAGDIDEEIGLDELVYPDSYATPRAVNE